MLWLQEEGPHSHELPNNLKEGKGEDMRHEEQRLQGRRLRRVLHKNEDQEDKGGD